MSVVQCLGFGDTRLSVPLFLSTLRALRFLSVVSLRDEWH